MQIRSEFNQKIKRVVLKLGSLAVTQKSGGIRLSKMREICSDISALIENNIEVVIVSSGAINAGRIFLQDKSKAENEINIMQACASIGQPLLMKTYQKLFNHYGLVTGQVLLTHDDVKNNQRYFNLKNTFETLIQNRIIPIVNENDSVSFEEITLGDNDQLASLVSEIVGADALILLSESDGLYNDDPRLNPQAKAIEHVAYDDDFTAIKFFKKTSVGKGGMQTKLEAVKKLTPTGTAVVLASFKHTHPVLRALTKGVGSFFAPAPNKIKSRKKSRLLTRLRQHTSVLIDDGAAKALTQNASLLAVGIKSVHGLFQRGDVIAIKHNHNVVAYGICEYDSKTLTKIRGSKSEDIKKMLGPLASKVIIHKNNLIMKEKK